MEEGSEDVVSVAQAHERSACLGMQLGDGVGRGVAQFGLHHAVAALLGVEVRCIAWQPLRARKSSGWRATKSSVSALLRRPPRARLRLQTDACCRHPQCIAHRRAQRPTDASLTPMRRATSACDARGPAPGFGHCRAPEAGNARGGPGPKWPRRGSAHTAMPVAGPARRRGCLPRRHAPSPLVGYEGTSVVPQR